MNDEAKQLQDERATVRCGERKAKKTKSGKEEFKWGPQLATVVVTKVNLAGERLPPIIFDHGVDKYVICSGLELSKTKIKVEFADGSIVGRQSGKSYHSLADAKKSGDTDFIIWEEFLCVKTRPPGNPYKRGSANYVVK